MRTFYIFIFTILLFILPSKIEASATVDVIVNGKKIHFPDVNAQIIDGRVLVPLRGVFEAMDVNVNWNSTDKTITSSGKGHLSSMIVEMEVNSPYVNKDHNYFTLNGMKNEGTIVKLDQTPILMNSRTMIPLRASGESFGYTVNWNSTSKTATLKITSSLKAKNSSFKEYGYLPSDRYEPLKEELDVFFLTNKERENAGKEPFVLNADLSFVASKKSLDLYENQYFDHTSPRYGSPFEMMDTFGINYQMAGENIAAGQPTSTQVVNAWMNSPGHRANILNSGFEEIGIGFIHTNKEYKTYWTQMFITQ